MSESEPAHEDSPTLTKETSPPLVISPRNEVPFVATTTSAPVEASSATAVPVKPYNPEPHRSVTEMTSVLDSDRQALIGDSSDDSLSSDDSDYGGRRVRLGGSRTVRVAAKWWFQEPAVKKNMCVVIGAWILVFLGIASFLTGIVLEATYHGDVQAVVRGVIFFVVAIVVLIPSVYAVLHIYLAAKRVGKITLKTIWFFR